MTALARSGASRHCWHLNDREMSYDADVACCFCGILSTQVIEITMVDVPCGDRLPERYFTPVRPNRRIEADAYPCAAAGGAS